MAVSVTGPRAVYELGGPVIPGMLSLQKGDILISYLTELH